MLVLTPSTNFVYGSDLSTLDGVNRTTLHASLPKTKSNHITHGDRLRHSTSIHPHPIHPQLIASDGDSQSPLDTAMPPRPTKPSNPTNTPHRTFPPHHPHPPAGRPIPHTQLHHRSPPSNQKRSRTIVDHYSEDCLDHASTVSSSSS